MKDQEFGSLKAQRALVTGASSGIGRAIALELACAGADVLIHCRKSTLAAEDVACECRKLGRRSEVLVADLADEARRAALVAEAWDKWQCIDVWVNNAGADVLTGPAARLDFSAKLRRVLEVDVQSTMVLSREAGARMRASGQGVILNIGWDQADRGMAGDSGELFAAAKNAIMGFTRSLAVSLAPQVRVNCIAPGWIRTAWGQQASDTWQERVRQETPLRRWGEPEDIASLARFLVSPAASYITGQVICANGGAVR